MTATLLLTRPAAQSQAFARLCRARLGGGPDLRIIVSPLQRIDWLSGWADRTALDADDILVFTSANGVHGYIRLHPALGRVAWCVGAQTTRVAQAAGFSARQAGRDGRGLLASMPRPAGGARILHPGAEVLRVDIAGALRSEGFDARHLTVYRQVSLPLTPEALALVRRPGRIVAPQFSPAAAAWFARSVPPSPRILTPCLSAAVRDGLGKGNFGPAPIVASPNARSMLNAVAECLRTRRRA
jgi:uroporphyrinogen-III synthase